MKSAADQQLKAKATQKEYARVFRDFQLPPKNITVECSDGVWIRRAWTNVSNFGWDKWEKI